MFTMKEIPTYVDNKTYVITAQIITCKILSEKQESPILDGIWSVWRHEFSLW